MNGIPNKVLMYFHKDAVTLLALSSMRLSSPITSPNVEHSRVISSLKLGKDPPLTSSYRPMSSLDTIGELFEKILLATILNVGNEHVPMRDEHFGLIPRHTRSLQLVCLVERITRDFD